MHKILIATHEVNLATLIDARLTVENFHPLGAHQFDDCIRLALSQHPNLMIADTALPGFSSEKMKQLLGTKIPTILLTPPGANPALFSDLIHATLIEKPVIPFRLINAVRKKLSLPIVRTKAKSVLVAGNEAALVDKTKTFFEAQGWEIEVGIDRDDIVETVKKNPPQILIIQFWESKEAWDAEEILLSLRPVIEEQKILPLLFCANSLAIEAKKSIPWATVITHQTSEELITKLKPHLHEGKK